jgi:hypothetical protein
MVVNIVNFLTTRAKQGRSQWPHGLRHRFTAARLLRSWVRISPGAWMFVCCVLSSGGPCDKLITHPRGVLLIMAHPCVIKKPRVTSWPIKNGQSRWVMPVTKINIATYDKTK